MRGRIIATSIAAALVAAAITGLAGWAMLLVLLAMVAGGLVIFANEAAKRARRDIRGAGVRR